MAKQTIFIEDIKQEVTVCGVVYSIHQDSKKQELQITIKKTQQPIYTYSSFETYVLKYKKQYLETIHEIFKEAKFDRYVL